MQLITLKTLSERLTNCDAQEARSIVRQMLYDCFGMSFTDICCGALNNLDAQQLCRLNALMERLERNEPVQYITGKADFCCHTFHVEPGVLIPRPETEELCDWIIEYANATQSVIGETSDASNTSIENTLNAPQSVTGKTLNVLDIGTGSGCIAITLALGIGNSKVSAWDISDKALNIARCNAKELGANIDLRQQDALSAPDDNKLWDVIVSNPPYICLNEAKDMEANVLDHEPHLALFVPDNDPLLFYRKIAEYATHALKEGGSLFFEINSLYANDTIEMLNALGFNLCEIKLDAFGKQRMIKAERY